MEAIEQSELSKRQFFEVCYPELRRIAGKRMAREDSDHTWQPTALVNELYLALRESKRLPVVGSDEESRRSALLALAGFWMKRMLIHHARPLYRQMQKVSFDSPDFVSKVPETRLPSVNHSMESLSEIDQLLDRLGELDPKLRTVVELRVFEGLTGDEIANQMGCSRRTITQYWTFARKWLQKALTKQSVLASARQKAPSPENAKQNR